MFLFFKKGREDMTLSEVTERLNLLRTPIALVYTPVNFNVERKKFLESDDYNPQFRYKIIRNENDKVFSSLQSLKRVTNIDPSISDFYVELVKEKMEASELLHAVGDNDEVSRISKERFRMPSPVLFRNSARILRGKVEKYKLIDQKKVLESRWMGFDEVKEAVDIVLKEVGLDDWKVIKSKKIAKNGVRTLLKGQSFAVDAGIRKRAMGLRKTIVHEIGTHVLRSYNGKLTGYNALYKPNVMEYLDVEEGLAMWNEENMRLLSYRELKKRALQVWSIQIGEYMTFRELYNALLGSVHRLEAFNIAYRVKRGLSDTSKPGIFCKDVVYLRGFHRVRAKLEKDASLYNKLYAGKIGFSQTKWVDDGLIPYPKLVLEPSVYETAFKKAGI